MKRFSYAIALTLALTTAIPPAQSHEAGVTHLHNSAALPNNAIAAFATYRVRLHVETKPLTQLSINLPEDLRVTEAVEITNQAGQRVDARVTVENGAFTIAFTQPVSPETLLQIDLNGVRTSDLVGRTWLLPIAMRNTNGTANIPLGFARIQTSK